MSAGPRISMDAQHDRCHLMNLPPELRLKIFGHIFSDWRCGIGYGHGTLWRSPEKSHTPNSGILLVCRTLSREASEAILKCAEFVFDDFSLWETPPARDRICELGDLRFASQLWRVSIGIKFREQDGQICGPEDMQMLMQQLKHCAFVKKLALDFYWRGWVDPRDWPMLDRLSHKIRDYFNSFKCLQCSGKITARLDGDFIRNAVIDPFRGFARDIGA
ncbi:hypothetical protein LTR95_001663 [Oleoguttula sp. CCFEE 5521]